MPPPSPRNPLLIPFICSAALWKAAPLFPTVKLVTAPGYQDGTGQEMGQELTRFKILLIGLISLQEDF